MPLSLSVTSAGSISMVFTSAGSRDSLLAMGGARMGRHHRRHRLAGSAQRPAPEDAGDGERLEDDQDPERRLIASARIPDQADQARARTRDPPALAALTMPKTVPNERCAELARASGSAGSVIMLPTARPTTRLPTYSTAGVGYAASAAKAAALDADVAPRRGCAGPTRSARRPNAEAAEQRGHRRRAHRQGGGPLAERRREHADLVDEEPDLGGQRQRERHRHRPEERRAQGLLPRPFPLRRTRPRALGALGLRFAALAARRPPGRASAPDHERDQRQARSTSRAGRREERGVAGSP